MKSEGFKYIVLSLLLLFSGCSSFGIGGTPAESTATPTNTATSPEESPSTLSPIATATSTPTPEQSEKLNYTTYIINNIKSENTTGAKLNTPYRRGGEAWVGSNYGLSYEEFTTAALQIQEISLEDHSSGPGRKLIVKQTVYNESHLAYTVNVYFLTYVDMIRQVINSNQSAVFNQIEIRTYSPSSDTDQPVEITRITERQVFLYHLRSEEYTLKKALGFIKGQSRDVYKQGRQEFPVELKQELDSAADRANDNITINRIEMQDRGMLITFTSNADPDDRAAWAAQSYLIFRTIGTAEHRDDVLPDRIESINIRGYSTHGDRDRDLISYVSAGDETAIAYANGSVSPVEAASAIHGRTLFEDDRLNR